MKPFRVVANVRLIESKYTRCIINVFARSEEHARKGLLRSYVKGAIQIISIEQTGA